MSNTKAAFPRSASSWNTADTGMSLRDFFAAQAMNAMVYKSSDGDGGWDPVAAAVGCYLLADAMLKAREA